MDSKSKDQLLRRIARLARQNKELEDQVKKLEREKGKILEMNERYRGLLERTELPGARPAEEEKSFRYNMVTVSLPTSTAFQGLLRIWTPPG